MSLLKGNFPFSVGTTSYIINTKKDNLIANVNYLMDKVSKIQLLLFGKKYLNELINDEYLKRLIDLKNKSGVEYTIHLPIDLDLLNESADNLEKSFDVIAFIFEKTSCLDAGEYILHIDFSDNFKYGAVELSSDNLKKFDFILQQIKSRFSSQHKKILIENTGYDLIFFCEPILKHEFNICMDIGHLFISNLDFNSFIAVFDSKIKEIHLHGFRGNKDHLSLKKIDRNNLALIFNYLKTYKESLIIEVFNKKKLKESARVLNKYFNEGVL